MGSDAHSKRAAELVAAWRDEFDADDSDYNHSAVVEFLNDRDCPMGDLRSRIAVLIRAVEREAIERCAKECQLKADGMFGNGRDQSLERLALDEASRAIRALLELGR